eukprot:Hpha_TRINITY_DN15391_c5_g2::TRINITY_DN15391_c5_g2_i1::g.90879::m.90879/K01202/GALC; galactosylceramidase
MVLPTPAPTPAPPKGPFALDDSAGLGLRWEGVGAISGGGATSKLLLDYPEAARSNILDYLFKPDFGLNLQMLKVEIGGDTDATEGAEPSHMHYSGDEDYNRGYEWWLMKEAKKRNPGIKLYGLPWGWAGWLDPKATSTRPATDAFADPSVTANYTLAWLRGAKLVHGLDIDYVGQWNERNAPTAYADALRAAVAKDSVVGDITTVLNRLPHYPGTHNTMDKQGCKQYAWNETDGSRWVDEEGSIYDGRSARCLARCVNRNYVGDCHTATFQWHLVSSFYDYLPWARCGVAVANKPWNGHYEITSPTWALAHTSQFAPIGWRFAAHGAGVTTLEHGGSLVTRISPDKKDFSVVIEKMDSSNSVCARGSNPSLVTGAEDVTLVLKGSFLAAARRVGRLQVWYSNLTSSSDKGVNPPDAQLFQKLDPVVVGADGMVTLKGVSPSDLYTITTLTTGGKGSHPVPADGSFPLPFVQSFDGESLSAPPAVWYDQMGAWEVHADPYQAGTQNHVMRQMVPVWPECWGYSCSGPKTYFGPAELGGGVNVSVKVQLEADAAWTLGAGDAKLTINSATGAFTLKAATAKSEGSADFKKGSWHRCELHVAGGYTAALLDGKLLANVTHGVKDGWYVSVELGSYIFASMDDFALHRL